MQPNQVLSDSISSKSVFFPDFSFGPFQELEEVNHIYVLCTDYYFDSIDELSPLIKDLVVNKADLLIFARKVKSDVFPSFRYIEARFGVHIYVANLGDCEEGELLRDLKNVADFCAASMVVMQQGEPKLKLNSSMLGYAEQVRFAADHTSITNKGERKKLTKGQSINEMDIEISIPNEAEVDRLWNSWKHMFIGHKRALAVMLAVRNRMDYYLSEMENNHQDWVDKKAPSQKKYDDILAQEAETLEAEKKKIQKEIDDYILKTENRKQSVTILMNAADTFSEGLPSYAKDKLNKERASIRDSRDEVLRAIDQKIEAYKALQKEMLAELMEDYNKKLDEARGQQIDRDEDAEKLYEKRRRIIYERWKAEVGLAFNRASIQAYKAEVLASRFNPDNYECPTEVPDYVMLGNIGLVLNRNTADEEYLVQAIEMETGEEGKIGDKEYVVELPYAQRLQDGISLLLRHKPSQREQVQEEIQLLLLKLFMSFPAGKLEATMIDPLELGKTFSDIPKLAEGPNSARIIDTKIWSQEKDIENAISNLRRRLENISQAYGTDYVTRLKKEVIRVLAITDFPIGFNGTALRDLHAIVRNSASLGVCVLISADDIELEKLKKNNNTLVAEITEKVVEIERSKDSYWMRGIASYPIYLRLDEMVDVYPKKNKILSLIGGVIERAQVKIESFQSMFSEDIYDSNTWFMGAQNEVAIPIGIKGASTVVKMVLGRGGGSIEHHALITGQTGAGKSTFFHTLIMSTLISYSPNDVQLYLLDFKEGVEFNVYTKYRLPSLRVVAINSEREFGLNVLKELTTELETRAKYFARYGVTEIGSYERIHDVPKVPRLLLIFDEVQELFRSRGERDTITEECLSAINRLVMQGRALGIHLILACQDFRNCAGLENYFSQMAIRIAVKGSEEGASSILHEDNAGIRSLQNQSAGAAIYNNACGIESANNFFQVSYLEEEAHLELLQTLHAYYTDPDIAPLFEEYQTRLLITNVEDNIYNSFNQLILRGLLGTEPLGSYVDSYGLLIGQGFEKKRLFMPELRREKRDNLLILTKDEKMAISMVELCTLSVLYEELHRGRDKKNELVYIVDYTYEELEDEECDFEFLASLFPGQVKWAKRAQALDMIYNLYEKVLARAEGSASTEERVFLMFFGLNRARNLRPEEMDKEFNYGGISPIEMLETIFEQGPVNGVNSIVWGESTKAMEFMLGTHYYKSFNKRIAYALDEETMQVLVDESDMKSMRAKTAVFWDSKGEEKNSHFRPYEVPIKDWVEDFAEAYKAQI